MALSFLRFTISAYEEKLAYCSSRLHLLAVVGVSNYVNPTDKEQQNSATSAPSSGISEGHTAQSNQNTQTTKRPLGWRRYFTWPEGVAAICVLLTLFFIAWQALLTRQAIISSENSSKRELRAYLVVSINTASYQERDKGIRFQGTPVLVNTGKTPAHKVRYRTTAAVLKEPLLDGYVFVPSQTEVGEYVLGMDQNFIIPIIVDDFVDPQDVSDIMLGTKGKALYYWGVVNYEDTFGDAHSTEFCHRLYFSPNPESEGTYRVNGNYLAGQNKAT
jgi:hypothetical protein